MAPKKSRKPVQETMVEEPTQDREVPSQVIREEEQVDFEEQENQENHDDHENEKEQPTIVLFTLEQLEVLLKMNRFDFSELVAALKGWSSKGVGFQPAKLGNFDEIREGKVIDTWLMDNILVGRSMDI